MFLQFYSKIYCFNFEAISPFLGMKHLPETWKNYLDETKTTFFFSFFSHLWQQNRKFSLGKSFSNASSPSISKRQAHKSMNVFLRLFFVLQPPLGNKFCWFREVAFLVWQNVVRENHMSLQRLKNKLNFRHGVKRGEEINLRLLVRCSPQWQHPIVNFGHCPRRLDTSVVSPLCTLSSRVIARASMLLF